MTTTDESTTARVEAFSDGVLAIAITLLVLEIHVPEVHRGESLAHALLQLWPKYATFAVSFVTIGIMWVNHHSVFERIARVDRRLMFINLFLLLTISFVPFPTAVLGTYVRDAHSGHAAAVLYGVNMLLVGAGFVWLWVYLLRHPELRAAHVTDEMLTASFRRTLVGPALYGIAIILSLLSAPGALALYAAVALYFTAGRFPGGS